MNSEEAVAARLNVSRETAARLLRFESVFDRWQKRINLVAPSTIPEFWDRHVADSLQLVQFAPLARSWVDLGSGGGFPGLVVAAARQDLSGSSTVLVESNGKKAAFLREAARFAGIQAEVRDDRLEAILPRLQPKADVISARALAPLAQLVVWCEELLKTGSMGLYLKGRDAISEISQVRLPPELTLKSFPSRIDPQSAIVAIWNPERSAGPQPR